MSPITHFLLGWLVANLGGSNRRERAVIALAGVAPDLDGLGLIAEVLTRDSERPLLWWTEYHHVLAHNLGAALVAAAVGFAVGQNRLRIATLAFISLHLHLLGDLVGARGPDGYQWPIPYLRPFSEVWIWSWSGQWELNAWPNFVVSGVALALTFYLAWRRGFGPLELVSSAADRAFVGTLRQRFSAPGG